MEGKDTREWIGRTDAARMADIAKFDAIFGPEPKLSMADMDLKFIGDYEVFNVAEYLAQFENSAGTKRVRDDDEEVVVERKPAALPVDDGEVVVRHRPASKQPGYKRPSNALVRLKISTRTEFTVRHLNRIDFCIFDVDRHVVIGRENAKKKPDIELKGDKTISREHCTVTAVRDDNDCVVLHVVVSGKNGCIIDDQQIKSDTGQVTVVPAGPHRFQFGSIHFDVVVAAKTLKKIKPTPDDKDKIASSKDGAAVDKVLLSSRSLARQRKEMDKKSAQDADQNRDREANALSAIASEYLECRRNIGIVLALEEHCNDAAALFEEFKLFPMFPLPMHRRMLEVFAQVGHALFFHFFYIGLIFFASKSQRAAAINDVLKSRQSSLFVFDIIADPDGNDLEEEV
jgi:hypothetical protein